MPPTTPNSIAHLRGDDLVRRLRELYTARRYDDADRLAGKILAWYPETEITAEALWIRSLHRRKCGQQEEALDDLLTAADQGTGAWSLRSAHRAGVHCQLLDWIDRAQVVFEQLIRKWPLTTTAARAAEELAWIHRGTGQQKYWEDVQVDILHRLVCDPSPGSDDDLAALQQAVESFLQRPEEGGPPRDIERARSCAQELLRRATDREKAEYVKEAKLALTAIESGRSLNAVWTLAGEGDDPRLPDSALN